MPPKTTGSPVQVFKQEDSKNEEQQTKNLGETTVKRTSFVQRQKPQISLEKQKGMQAATYLSCISKRYSENRRQNRFISTTDKGEGQKKINKTTENKTRKTTNQTKNTLDGDLIGRTHAKASPWAGPLPAVSRVAW